MAFVTTPGKDADVSTRSGERVAMDRDLELIEDIRAGADAVREHSTRYLPRYEMESWDEYSRRVKVAPWRAEFVDSLLSLASKPFGQDVALGDDTPEVLQQFANDVDGRGNNLSRFARQSFEEGIASGAHAILVDFPHVPKLPNRPRTIAEETEIGAEPYWLQIPLKNIISVRTTAAAGREIVTHFRFSENVVEPDGFGEKVVQRVRVIEPGFWQVWEKDDKEKWQIVEGGSLSLDEVPVALFFTGQRIGTLQTKPPLRDLAEIQMELFRAMSRQDEILTYSGSPMLAASGIAKPADGEQQIQVGPKTILFAPPSESGHSRWEYVSPDSGAIGEIRQQVAAIVQDMKRLGMQPTTPQSGNITATATSVEAAKAHSALEAWALGLKDALEVAFYFTAKFYAIDHATTVEIFTDFVEGDQSTAEGTVLLAAEKQSVISKQTVREELKRRNLLGPAFDEEAEELRLASEQQGLEPEEQIDPATGESLAANDDLKSLFAPDVLAAAGMA